MKHNQDGSINALLIPLILVSLLFVGSAVFAGWAYTSRQDYKNNTDQKIADAVVVARQLESTEKDKQFAEAEKQPLKNYNGPSEFGGIEIAYPKTWSSYVNTTSGSAVLEGYFHPGTVPSVGSPNSTYALRYQVLSRTYDSVLQEINSSYEKKLSFEPYALPKVPRVVGIKAVGQVTPSRQGQLIILPLRDKTLKIWTEGDQFTNDFANHILPNVNFSP